MGSSGHKKNHKRAAESAQMAVEKDDMEIRAFGASSLSPSGAYFGILSPSVIDSSFRLRIWATESNTLLCDYSGAEGSSCPRFVWQSSSDSIETLQVALCLGSGIVDVLSISQKAVISSLYTQADSAVVDFVFRKSKGFSLSANGLICEWDLSSFVLVRSVSAAINATRIVVDSKDSKIAVAGHQIMLYDSESLSLLHTWTGHSTPVSDLQFTSNDVHLISLANQERSLSVWSCLNLTKANCSAIMVSDAELKRFALSSQDRVVAVTEHGSVVLWESPLPQSSEEKPKKKRKSKQISVSPSGLVKIVNEEEPSTGLPIYVAQFSEESLLTVRGCLVRPVFEKLPYLTADGVISEVSTYPRPITSQNLLGDSVTDGQKTVTEPMKVHAMSFQQGAQAPLVISTLEMEPTMEEKLKAMSLTTQRELKKVPRSKVNTVASLGAMLNQAVTSDDHELLEECFKVRNVRVIVCTVQRLPSTLVPELIRQVVQRLQGKPARGPQLIDWIRAALIYHASYLMSVPDLAASLSALYRTLETRLTTFEKMLKLSGRLDMIICQYNIRRRSEMTDEELAENAEEALYTLNEEDEEEDSFDDEDDEDDMAIDSDVDSEVLEETEDEEDD